ncbi:MAG TPA: tRNA-uridine aminocarboxypropyltransferase [Kofleriaceae bacterium]|nr:tRNA-uridine aminocarboxypropyltransferase [Kofleriaceae bacterium]
MLHGRVLDPGRCPRCCFRREVCLCAELPRVEARTRVVIVRHHTERFRASNSGRLAHLALAGSELRDVFAPGPGEARPEASDLGIGAGAWLLFPEGEPRTVAPAPPPRELVVLDATWHQARRMRQRLPALRGLPVLSLATLATAARMRRSPDPGRVSTIEAIAAALRLLEGDAVAAPLERLFEVAVGRMQQTGRPTHPGLPGGD